jgi:D-alanyl-D-alanine carboxypeptidase
MIRVVQHLSFCSILLLSLTGYAQSKDDYALKIDSLLQTTSPRSFNGVVLITQKGKTKYAKAYGYSNFEDKMLLTAKDNFRIMSNSKQVTAVLVLKEVERGKIDLHSPIRKYLPDLQHSWADTVTVHHLLNFTAGISDINKPLVFKPGTNFLYGVATYTLLGKIIEMVTGKRFIDVANSLFKELTMDNTFCYEEGKENKLVKGYVNTDNVFKLREHQTLGKEWIDFIPAGGIISNLKDLNTWDTKLHGGKILKPESYKLMTNYAITRQHVAFGNEKIGYGYGVHVSDKTPVEYIGHGGKGIGFTSVKVYFPEKDVDLIVLENQYHEDDKVVYHFEIKIREIVMNSSLVK